MSDNHLIRVHVSGKPTKPYPQGRSIIEFR
jgi:hypothetical protein